MRSCQYSLTVRDPCSRGFRYFYKLLWNLVNGWVIAKKDIVLYRVPFLAASVFGNKQRVKKIMIVKFMTNCPSVRIYIAPTKMREPINVMAVPGPKVLDL